MNNLEKALLDKTNSELDEYLETETTENIRRDVEQIQERQYNKEDATRVLLQLRKIITDSKI